MITTGIEVAEAIGHEFLAGKYEVALGRKRTLRNVVEALTAAGL